MKNAPASVTSDVLGEIPTEARHHFARELQKLHLAPEQIEHQNATELARSLQTVKDAILNPQAFGIIRISEAPRRRFRRSQERGIEVTGLGILPFLLKSRDLVEARLNEIQPARMPKMSVDSMAKSLGLVGILAFGILFTAYHQFYSSIGIKPEDVGITYAYIIARTIGLVFVVLLSLTYIGSLFLARSFEQSRKRKKSETATPGSRRYSIFIAVVTALTGVLLLLLGTGTWQPNANLQGPRASQSAMLVGSGISITLLGLMIVIALANRKIRPAAVATAALIAVILVGFSTGLAYYGRAAGSAVYSGEAVNPVSILGVPLLDVQARRVIVEWVGPAGQRPTKVFSSSTHVCSLDLGRSPTSQYLVKLNYESDRFVGHLVNLPVAFVAIRDADLSECRSVATVT